MNKVVTVKGFCPTQNCNYQISINYIDADDDGYLKGTYKCEHNIFGDKCSLKECPLYKSAK